MENAYISPTIEPSLRSMILATTLKTILEPICKTKETVVKSMPLLLDYLSTTLYATDTTVDLYQKS